jgi:hypothetical protein
MRKEALATHELARQTMRERITQNFKGFKKGQMVWLKGKNLRITYPSRKLALRREGPFKIIEEISKITYHLKLPSQWCINNVFHVMHLTPYQTTEEHGLQQTSPPPDLIDREEEYKIKVILNHKGNKAGTHHFLVLWKGYNSMEWIKE